VPDVVPIWTPDGRRIVYSSAQGGPPNIFSRPADGSGDEMRLTNEPTPRFPSSFDTTGRHLVLSNQRTGSADFDVSMLPIEGDAAAGFKAGTLETLVGTPATEAFGAVSPDGKWLAYASDEGPRFEVYVRSFASGGGRWQISTTSGAWPVWSRTRPELIYATGDGQLMSVTYDGSGNSFRASRPEPWSSTRVMLRSTAAPFALHPDGNRIAASSVAGQPDARVRSFVVVTDFLEELRKGTAAAK
jgi:Tol biopolymer transport system component